MSPSLFGYWLFGLLQQEQEQQQQQPFTSPSMTIFKKKINQLTSVFAFDFFLMHLIRRKIILIKIIIIETITTLSEGFEMLMVGFL